MKLFEVKETMPSVKTPTPEELAKKYKVSVARVNQEVKRGTKVELEHTEDRKKAREIALDHLGEFLDYYDRLEKAEKS